MSTNELYEEASKHIISIGNNHEKGMKSAFFSPLTMKCVLPIKESYSKGKKVKIFTFAYGQAGSDDPPPPYGQPDRTISVFFMASLRDESIS